jgi:predicted amidohydrolase
VIVEVKTVKKRSLKSVILQLDNLTPYQKNLDKILHYIKKYRDHDLIVAPEVFLTDYDYENIEEACRFGDRAEEILKEIVESQIVLFTKLRRRGEGFINEAVVIHRHRVVHRQAKHKLFLLGDEDKYLLSGSVDEVKPFEIDGVKYGILICFELRYKELWKRLEGCDVIVVPSQWGEPRKRHLEILSQALAIVNQCFVVVANSAKETMAKSSSINSPNGGVIREDMSEVITSNIKLSLVKKIRKYIRI